MDASRRMVSDHGLPSDPTQQNDDGHHNPSGKGPVNTRKRTKTGCLTCRRRRIKCDENKPTCNNCVKSKRACEGYSQRVVFKLPASQNHYDLTMIPPGSDLEAVMLAQQLNEASQAPLQAIAPKPLSLAAGQPQFGPFQPSHQSSYYINRPPVFPKWDRSRYRPLRPSTIVNPLAPPLEDLSHLRSDPFRGFFPVRYDNAGEGSSSHFPSLETTSGNTAANPENNMASTLDVNMTENENSFLNQTDTGWVASAPEFIAPVAPMSTQQATSTSQSISQGPEDPKAFYIPSYPANVIPRITTTQWKTMFESEEMKATFRHFISVTGPSMSMYERKPYNASNPTPVEVDADLSRNIWSYSFPVLAMGHPALLNVMLSLASLQTAKLRDFQPITAWRYYHKAVQALKTDLSDKGRRRLSETLAATLLLSYYEVWSSDHTKWCQHLKGARILFSEIPMTTLSRIVLPIKRMREIQGSGIACSNIGVLYYSGLSAPGKDEHGLNWRLISSLVGFNVKPDTYGLREGQPLHARSLQTCDRNISAYDHFRDLFWWYCKMDVYQSILGGTKLFMEYNLWTQCPPRAAFSNIDAVYGTFDHLILLLGRVANFTSNDLARKRKVNKTGESPVPFPGMLPAQEKINAPSGFTSSTMRCSPPSDSNEDAESMSRDTALQEWEKIRNAYEIFETGLGPGFRPLDYEVANERLTPFGTALQYRSNAIAGIWMNYYMGLICLHRSHPDMPPAAMEAARIVAPTTAHFANEIGRIAAGIATDLSESLSVSTILAAALVESSFCTFVAAVQFKSVEQRNWVLLRMRDISRLTGWQSAKQVAKGCEAAWAKAAQLGQGPPFVRPPNIEQDPTWIWQNPRRIDQHIRSQREQGEQQIILHAPDQTNYALGLLGVEQDLNILDLNE